jgi:YVTN family beta-propeller protein
MTSAMAGSIAIAGVIGAQTTMPTAPGTLLVLSKQEQTLSIVDGATLAVVARIPVGHDPHEVIASADGRTAYVSNYGGGAYNTLAVVDLLARSAQPSIDLGALRGPHGLAFADGKPWFTAEAAKAIGRFDPATHTVDWILGTGQDRTHMIYVSADAKLIITTNVNSGTVSIIEQAAMRGPGGPPGGGPGAPPGGPGAPPGNGPPAAGAPGGPPPGPRTDWHETVVRVGNGSEGFDVSPDQKEVWVANAQDGTISVIDLATKRVTATLTPNVRGANRLKFTPDGQRVLVSTLAGPDLVILDAHSRAVVRRVPVGHGAAGIVIPPDGARAFVACTPDDYVAVIDLRTLTVASHIAAGREPDGLAWVPAH